MKLLFAFGALFISITGICQNGDYLVKTNGDTIRGSIELKNKVFEIGDNIKTSINAADVRTIKSRKYSEGAVVACKLQLYNDNILMLEYGYSTHRYVDTIMILKKILVTPKMDLYFGKDKYKSQYYFYKTPADPLPVQLFVSYYLEGGLDNYGKNLGGYDATSATYVTEEKVYINQLRWIMRDCRKITDTWWELLTYRNYSLIQLIKEYNECE